MGFTEVAISLSSKMKRFCEENRVSVIPYSELGWYGSVTLIGNGDVHVNGKVEFVHICPTDAPEMLQVKTDLPLAGITLRGNKETLLEFNITGFPGDKLFVSVEEENGLLKVLLR